MQWNEFYEKARYEWAASTTTSRLSKLESLGSPEEVADLVEYYMDDTGMVRLINRAMSAEIVFSGEQVLNMVACLEEKDADALVSYALKQNVEFTHEQIVELAGSVSLTVMNQVASRIKFPFTEEQAEELAGYIDDELLQKIRVAPKASETAPDERELPKARITKPMNLNSDSTGTSEKKSVFRKLFPKKYRYVFVLFQSASQTYCYRTKDKSIKQGDIVMVPVAGKALQPAYVSEVRIVTENNVPYPLEKTKMVIGKAKRKIRKAFVMNDNRIPMDISRYRIGTPNGVIEVTTTEAERKVLREKYKNHPRVKIIETRKPASPQDAQDWIDEIENADALFDDPELGEYISVMKDIRRKQVEQASETARKKKNKDDFWTGVGATMLVDDTIDSIFGKK